MSPTAVRRVLTGALSLALAAGATAGVAACGDDDDISRERFLADYTAESPHDDEVDECIVDHLFEVLDQDQINDFYPEDPSDEELTDEGRAALEDAALECIPETVDGATTTAPTTDPEAEPGVEPDADPGVEPDAEADPEVDPEG